MNARLTKRAAPMRADYDFDYSKAVRGKYHKKLLREGAIIVVLDRDVDLKQLKLLVA